MVLIYAVLFGIALECAGGMPAVKQYASKYDHISVETILNNRRLVNYYAACLLSRGPCPPEGVEFKRVLPEALQSNCERCTEKQIAGALRAIRRIKKEYPKIWYQLSEKWDPDDIYVRKFETTFGTKAGPNKPPKDQPTTQPAFILNRFGGDEDDSNSNNINENPSTTSSEKPTTHSVLITTKIPPSSTINTNTKTINPNKQTLPVNTAKTTLEPIASSTPNILGIPSSTFSAISTPLSSTLPSFISSFTTTSKSFTTTSKPSTTASSISSTTQSITSTTSESKSSTKQPVRPGFIPINTFFTNPPIPIRPIIDINIGANIGATVKAIKQVERIIAGAALKKLGIAKQILFKPWRRFKRK